jgi:hypothetical protein
MRGLAGVLAAIYLAYSIITDLIIWGAALYYLITSFF